MRKHTDLGKVKQTAFALLSTEINETQYSPMIVKHPFTDTGVTALPDGNGGLEMLNLTEDADALFNAENETGQCKQDAAVLQSAKK